MKIPILLDEYYLNLNIIKRLMQEPEKAPHAVSIDATGSGKTYFSKLFLGKIALYTDDAEIYVCDFKGDDDFSFLKECKNYYRFIECADGLTEFYTCFTNRQQGQDTSRSMIVLFFDEWASYLNFIKMSFGIWTLLISGVKQVRVAFLRRIHNVKIYSGKKETIYSME